MNKDKNKKELYPIDWDKYLKPDRQRPSGTHAQEGWDCRNQFESDLGRVIFCPAIRRMHDKTQVIPLTSGDTILTRLTHSMQVMSVAESLAHNYTRTDSFKKTYGDKAYSYDASISAILRTAALLHDIGNPPFGHFGEITIQNYFKKYLEAHHIITERKALDFTQFDGNALGLRIVSKLQYTGTLDGLNLTYPTLGAYLKYPNRGKADGEGYVGEHKHGIFWTEETLFEEIVKCCNMRVDDKKIKRHPLSFLVEAADSICYGTMDMEDGYNIQWYTFDNMVETLDKYIKEKVSKKENGGALLHKYLRDENNPDSFSIEKLIGFKRVWDDGPKKDKRRLVLDFRVALINYLTHLAITNFENNLEDIDKGVYSNELLKEDPYEVFGALSDFSYRKIISRRDIQELELTGNSVINGLLDILMNYAFSEDKKYRAKIKAVISKSRMEVTLHENMHNDELYKIFEEEDLWNFDVEQLDNYSKLRLIVDFVASMTDKYSVELYQRFAGMRM
jgi:dGTPase